MSRRMIERNSNDTSNRGEGGEFEELFDPDFEPDPQFIKRVARLTRDDFRRRVGKLTGLAASKRGDLELVRVTLFNKFIQKHASHSAFAVIKPLIELAVPVRRDSASLMVEDISTLCIAIEEDNPSLESMQLITCHLARITPDNLSQMSQSLSGDTALVNRELVGAFELMRQQYEQLQSSVQKLCKDLNEERENRLRENNELSEQLASTRRDFEDLNNRHAELIQIYSKLDKTKIHNFLKNKFSFFSESSVCLDTDMECMEVSQQPGRIGGGCSERKRKLSLGNDDTSRVAIQTETDLVKKARTRSRPEGGKSDLVGFGSGLVPSERDNWAARVVRTNETKTKTDSISQFRAPNIPKPRLLFNSSKTPTLHKKTSIDVNKNRDFRFKNVVIGKGCSQTLKSAPRFRMYYAGFWAKSVTSNDIISHLSSLGVNVNVCTELKARHDSYRSYKFECDTDHQSVVLNPENWPKGILIKKFYEARKDGIRIRNENVGVNGSSVSAVCSINNVQSQ